MITIKGKKLDWRLAAVMKERGITPKELIDKMVSLVDVGESRSNIYKLMKAMPSRLRAETMLALCVALDCQAGDLLVVVDDDSAVSENDEPGSA